MATGKGGAKGGGSLRDLRSTFKRVAGGGKQKKRGEVTFIQVITWVFGIALLLFFVWAIRR